jgi:hypothetical protein
VGPFGRTEVVAGQLVRTRAGANGNYLLDLAAGALTGLFCGARDS